MSGTRAASDLGYRCTVVPDACATHDQKFADRVVPAADVHAAFHHGGTGVWLREAYFDGRVSQRKILKRRINKSVPFKEPCPRNAGAWFFSIKHVHGASLLGHGTWMRLRLAVFADRALFAQLADVVLAGNVCRLVSRRVTSWVRSMFSADEVVWRIGDFEIERWRGGLCFYGRNPRG